jgi:hypothetical protein
MSGGDTAFCSRGATEIILHDALFVEALGLCQLRVKLLENFPLNARRGGAAWSSQSLM